MKGSIPVPLEHGATLFRSLPSTASDERLLCTDLHAENVLAAQREPWLVIDPKPFVGDPTYDALQHHLNCQDRLVSDPVALGFAYGGAAGSRRRPPSPLALRLLRRPVGGLPLDARGRRADPALAARAGAGTGAVPWRPRLTRRPCLRGEACDEDLDDDSRVEAAHPSAVEVRRGDQLDGRGDPLAAQPA